MRNELEVIRKALIKAFPYLGYNHIFVARKKLSYDEMIAASPKIVNDMEQWLSQRKAFQKN